MHEDTLAILKQILFVIAAVILLAGCAPLRVDDREDCHIEGIRFPVNVADEPFIRLANENRRILIDDYSEERKFYPSNATITLENLRPQTGLALSGGGMRSASFSIGVMSGLAEHKDVFKSIDIISAVSGGSYALSWYYMQQYYMMETLCKCGADEKCGDHPACEACLARKADEKCKDHPACKACLAQLTSQLLDPKGPFQRHLAKSGDLTGHTRGAIWGAFNLLVSPLNILTNGLFGMRTNTAI